MSYADSEYDVIALKSELDHHLDRLPLANSTHYSRALPESACKEIASQYSLRGWSVGWNIGEGTTFSFIRS